MCVLCMCEPALYVCDLALAMDCKNNYLCEVVVKHGVKGVLFTE